MTDQARGAGHTKGLPRLEPVTALTKARNARPPKAGPKYRIGQTSVRAPFAYGFLRVKKPVDLQRAMDHWLYRWQHANPSISYNDLDPCEARWSRLNLPE